jgi:hypothetical protein
VLALGQVGDVDVVLGQADPAAGDDVHGLAGVAGVEHHLVGGGVGHRW